MRKTKNINQPETPKFPADRDDLIAKINAREVAFVKVLGDGFTDFGFSEGDFVFVEKTNALHENALSVFSSPDNEHLEMGYGYDNFGDLAYFDGKEAHRYKKGKAEVYGVIIGVLRPFSSQFGELKDGAAQEIQEITVVCDECQKRCFGTREFIKAEGWEFGENKRLCLNCYLKNEK